MIPGASQSLSQSLQGQNYIGLTGRRISFMLRCWKTSSAQPIVSEDELQSPGIPPPKAPLSWLFLERVRVRPSGFRTKFSWSCFSLKRESRLRKCCCCGGIDAEGMEKSSCLTWNREFLESMVRQRGPVLPKHGSGTILRHLLNFDY